MELFVRTAFYNTLLKERYKEREDGEEDVSNLRKREDTVTWKRKY